MYLHVQELRVLYKSGARRCRLAMLMSTALAVTTMALALGAIPLWAADGVATPDQTGGAAVGAAVVIDGATIFDDVIYDGSQPSPAVDPAAAPVVDEQTALEISRQLTLFEENLAALESNAGPYDVSLIEALLDMGRYYTQIGQHQSAAAVFERALNITRISDGLLSPQQLPVLQELTAAHKAAGAWQEVDDREQLAYYLNTRLHAPGTQAYAEAVVALGDWKLQALRGNLLGDSSLSNIRQIEELYEIYGSALSRISGAEFGAPLAQVSRAGSLPQDGGAASTAEQAMSRQAHFSLLYGRALTEYYLADYSLRTLPFQIERPVERYISEYVCADVVNGDGQVVRSCATVRRENPQYREIEMQRDLYRSRIRSALQALDSSVDELHALLATEPSLQAADGVPAQQRVDELTTLSSDINRAYRRSDLLR